MKQSDILHIDLSHILVTDWWILYEKIKKKIKIHFILHQLSSDDITY